MEIINIDKDTFEDMIIRFGYFRDRVMTLCGKHRSKGLNDWLDNQDVCLLLNISPRTLQSYRDTGKLGFSRINHKIYYKSSDIEKFLHSWNANSYNNNNINQNTKPELK